MLSFILKRHTAEYLPLQPLTFYTTVFVDYTIKFELHFLRMKKWISFLLAVVLAVTAIAQAPEEIKEASGQKYLKGFIPKQRLATDPAFGWFHRQTEDYTPDPNVLTAFKAAKDSIHILAFGGTWCDDTKFVIPRFFAIADAAGMDSSRTVLLGVDRDKKTIQHLSETFNVTLVPTLIVLKNGKEIGRVVEYGKTGMFDRELGEIVASAAGTKKKK
jgi:thiol-disulfide isomerase/thioredoxin